MAGLDLPTQAQMIVPIDDAILAAMPSVMAVYISQGVDITRVTGDPFFIATSAVHGLTLITSEVPRRGGAKIPKICEPLGVKTISLLSFIRQENWRF